MDLVTRFSPRKVVENGIQRTPIETA